jgi:hypothetical protein
MTECKYQHECGAYEFLVNHSTNPKCSKLLEICELENPNDIAEACNIYDTFANPPEFKAPNKKLYLRRNE